MLQCKRALMWSYAFGFYLEDKTRQKAMFEGDQAQLEKFADHLHELVEKPIEDVSALLCLLCLPARSACDRTCLVSLSAVVSCRSSCLLA